MKIRHKLMILLLAIALLPAALTSVLHRRSMLNTGDELAEQTRQILIRNATNHLQTVVMDFGRIVNRDKTAVALARQASEVEARLAAKPPKQPELFFSHDYDAGITNRVATRALAGVSTRCILRVYEGGGT